MTWELEEMAQRRYRAWRKLSDPTLTSSEKHDAALQARRLTALLNGHDEDCWREVLTTSPFHKPMGGMWATRRKGRLR